MKTKPVVLTFLLLTAYLIAPIQSATAETEYDQPRTTSYTWIQGLENFTHIALDESSGQLHVIEIDTMTSQQNVSCNSLSMSSTTGTTHGARYTGDYRWFGGPIRISADFTKVMCSNAIYSLNGTNLSQTTTGTFTGFEDIHNGWKATLTGGGQCWNRNDASATLSIQNQSTNISSVTLTRSGENAVVLRDWRFYEDDPMKILLLFNPSSSVTCDTTSSGMVRAVTINLSSTSSIQLDTSTGTSLGGYCGLFHVNFGGIVTNCSPTQYIDNEPWYDLDGANPWPSSAQSRYSSIASTSYGFHSRGPSCDVYAVNPDSGSSQYIRVNDTISTIPTSLNLDEDITSVSCTSDSNVSFIADGEIHTYWNDADADGYNDIVDKFVFDSTQYADQDGDGFGDNPNGNQSDACPSQAGASRFDRFGCSDGDFDGWSDVADAFPNRASQWNDTDGDGFGDNLTGFRGDACPSVFGDSYRNNTYGCLDADFDGWTDSQDRFPSQSSQWNDTDNDGYGDEFSGFEGDECPTIAGNSSLDRFGCPDQDGDGYSDLSDVFPTNPSQHIDTDGDGYGNNQSTGATQSDAFPNDGTQWNDSDGDGYGDNKYGSQGDHFSNDPSRWQDSDEDGYANEDDAFDNDATQWNDSDGDGYGDNQNGNNADDFPNNSSEWRDSDGDGIGDNSDAFRFDGSQWSDRDGDGYGDNLNGTNPDFFPDDPTRWDDSDRDGIADEEDDFPNDPSQSSDRDGDGYGDNPNGTNPDVFPDNPSEWRDSDGDGYGDNGDDAFPGDGTQWNDSDGDGYGDNLEGNNGDQFPDDPDRWGDMDGDGLDDSEDAFPNDPTQQTDRDGDGYGDNASGNRPDAFPDDPTEWDDVDNDGVGDNNDLFSFNPTQSTDQDGDGYGDNPDGSNPDAFPEDPTQHSDLDGDGYGDNQSGNNPDAFITDVSQWNDSDGDGYGDNPNGRNPDMFPKNPTQFEDADGDGLGDNQSGTNADPSLNDYDNDGYTDDIDILPKLASPGDLDNDGVLDEDDAFPADFRESKDSDGDGEGDNADVDDDNDGWTDLDEIREGTNPNQAIDMPVEGFEFIIPGTQVSLGAWDIIGIFTGVPLAAWIGLGLMTRVSRGRRFEDALDEATSLEELNQVAAEYESALMWKMLGPHQGLRLERMRTEIERDKFAHSSKIVPEITPRQPNQ
jgi:hypothetical protein